MYPLAETYALWRTETLNFSIRCLPSTVGVLRHLGWADPAADALAKERDVNGIL